MADQKPTSNFYDNLGGINQKASEYAVGRAQFLDIRNMDFDVPNALSKRPGSTQAVSSGTSGPINSVFEFVKLTGESYVVAGSDTAMFYLAVNTYTLLDSGWTNGQPTDMLTFVNQLWFCNGQKFSYWGASGAAAAPAGLLTPATQVQNGIAWYNSTSSTWMTVGGATMLMKPSSTASYIARGVYVAYSYLRNDGYQGPANFLRDAKNIITTAVGNGSELIGSGVAGSISLLSGFTVPSGLGISAISIWVACDTVQGGGTTDPVLGDVGNLGYAVPVGIGFKYMSITLKPGADLSRFNLYTTVSSASFFAQGPLYDNFTLIANTTQWCFPFALNFASLNVVATGGYSFSGFPGNFFGTYTPKYIEINQNSMFMGGFSSAPSVVWFSDVGTPETVQPESFFEVRTNDGDRIYAMRAYNNYLLIMKETSFHKVVGSNADNFQLVQLSDQYGCISDKSVVEYQEKLVWLDRKGILQFDGAGWRIISGAVEDIFRRMNIANAKEKACAVHWSDRNQIWFGIPIDNSTKNNITVVWDYLVDAWTFFDGFNAAAFAPVKGYLSRATTWRGDYSGLIHYHGDVFYGDNGQGITCLARPHWDKWQGEHSSNIWRRLFLDVAKVTGLTGAITGKVFSNYDNSTVQATYTIYQSQFQTRAEMGVVGKAVTTEFAHFSASLPLLINGYSWAKRNLRNV